ncbi:MAG TPA: twin-arginine translocase subunit TatB, partial [Anaerolineae bacterium]|nr:twin-arginine translocase subunit TatB [Anaerolineae bacterium]
NIFGVGPVELILVVILALIFLGPERLPELARQAGKLARELRLMTQSLTREFEEEIGPLDEVRDVVQALQELNPMTQVRAGIQETAQALNPLGDIQREVEKTKEALTSPVESGSRSEPSPTSSATAEGATSAPEAGETTGSHQSESSSGSSQATTEASSPETAPVETE